jgi:hypothetical protein
MTRICELGTKTAVISSLLVTANTDAGSRGLSILKMGRSVPPKLPF